MPTSRHARTALAGLAILLPWLGARAVQVPAPLKPQLNDSEAIKAGLVSWRTPGGKFNSACSSCHAPDAFDLARFNFDDTTIRRRALAHVGQADATKIVALVH